MLQLDNDRVEPVVRPLLEQELSLPRMAQDPLISEGIGPFIT